MLKKLVNECKFSLQLTTMGPLLVKSGFASPHSAADMTPVLTYRNGTEQVFIPGSSLKGVFRSHLEKVIRTINEPAVCVPFENAKYKVNNGNLTSPNYGRVFCGNKFELRKKKEHPSRIKDDQNKQWTLSNPDLTSDDAANSVVYRDSCPVCRLFGSTYFTGRVSIGDAYLVEDTDVREFTEPRDCVGIDRFSGGAATASGALFSMSVVSAGVTFELDVYLRNFEIWQLGALMLILQDLEDRIIRVGSGKSRGLGDIQGLVNKVNIQYINSNIEAKNVAEVWGLGKFLNRDLSYGTKPDDILSMEKEPTEINRNIRLVQEFTGDSLIELKLKSVNHFVQRIQNWSSPETMQFNYLQFQPEES